MKKILLLVSIALVYVNSSAQNATMTATGNWATTGSWSGGNVGNAVTKDVTINNNVSPTVFNGSSFTVGNTVLNNNNTLTINTGGTLNIGNVSNARNLTTNNNAQIKVAGTLVVWGNVIVNNNINWTISGTVIIKGNLVMVNNANVVVSGNLTIDGSLNGSNNTNITVSGAINVGGDVNVGNGSNLGGCAGCFNMGGACSGPAAFCGNGALPVSLLFIKAVSIEASVMVQWATATEKDFDRFLIERSADGKIFETIGEQKGTGNSMTTVNYSFEDSHPLPGNNYYRLKSVDLDQAFEYSRVIVASREGSHDHQVSNGISIYPNPSNGQAIYVVANFEVEAGARLQIFNNLGVKISEVLVEGTEQTVPFVSEPLRAGNYLLRYVAGSFVTVSRFSVNN
ncbi:MAG TPA: T9SS type A sorting domain-containing protein [Ohtaekwangia sp.]|nr:T9SS type A sorting domain-containing protein [Ohtaekwangia sp.]